MNETKQPFWGTARGMVSMLAIAFLGYFLLMEHRQHVFQYLPFLIILLCPFMHIFMHKGHGGDSNHDNSENEAYRRGLEDGKNQKHHRNNNR